MDGSPPPPPPPHGANPKTTSGLPPGNYDIFIIPPHSSGSGFLYLPSLQPQRNSFMAGVASTLVAVWVWTIVEPSVKKWVSTIATTSGGPGVFVLVLGVGILGWAFGRTQVPVEGDAAGKGPGPGPGPGHAGASGSHSGFGTQSPPPRGGYPNGAPPPNSHYPGAGGPSPGWGPNGHRQHYYDAPPHSTPPPRPPPAPEPEPPRPEARPQPPPPPPPQPEPTAQAAPPPPPPEPKPQAAPPPPPPPPEPKPEPKQEPPLAPKPTPQPTPQPEARPPPPPKPQPKAPPRPNAASEWEKARAETRRREEQRRREEEIRRKQEEEKRKREEAEKQARAAAEKEKWEKMRAREKETREREARERIAKDKLAKEKEAREKAAAEAQAKAEKEIREKIEQEKKQESDRERAVRERVEKIRAAREQVEALKKEEKEKSKPASYGVGERTDPYAGSVYSQARNAGTSPAKGNYERPTAKSYLGTEDAHSFRPYDQPRPARRAAPSTSKSSIYSESSYAPSQSTARTTPPPSQRGAYSTDDPNKIIIKGVYQFKDFFPKPVAQLVSGIGHVTDGLVLRITTEGLFIDDDVRGVPQREWDIKAWTMKLVETGEVGSRHILRASIRDPNGKQYVFVLPKEEAWKVTKGLEDLRQKGLQRMREGAARSLFSTMPGHESKKLLESLGYM